MLSLLLANTRRPPRATGDPVLRLSRERFARPACVSGCLRYWCDDQSDGVPGLQSSSRAESYSWVLSEPVLLDPAVGMGVRAVLRRCQARVAAI